MNSGKVMIRLRRGNWWWVRDHADERSVCRRRTIGVESIRGLPIAMIQREHSNSYHHQIVYLLQADGDARLDCRVRRTLEIPLGVAPHLQGEDSTAEEGTDHPRRRQSPILLMLDRIQQ